MSIEKPANERLNLYNRFKESLRSGDDSTFFDADDLIIIIDQAVDLQDEYTEIEAIMRGYRFFPDNEELAARRAFLYYDMDLDEGVDNVRLGLTDSSVLAQILTIKRISENEYCPEKVIPMLDNIVNTPGQLEDEEMIQLVDCAGSAQCHQWLKENEKRLRRKTDYLPTLLYELFIVFDMIGDRDYCIKLLEELTDLQPFNIDFWNALAQVLADDENAEHIDFDGALNALEYALAIDGTNPEALSLKASILLKQGKPAEALPVLKPVVDNNPSALAAQLYVLALIGTEQRDEAIKRLNEFCRKFPQDHDLVQLALSIDHPDIRSILSSHFSTGTELLTTLQNWNSFGEALYREGNLKDAITIFEFLHARDAISIDGYKLLFSALYAAGRYDRCIELYDEMKSTDPDMLLSEMILAVMMSYMRKGDKSAARKALKEVSARLPMNLRESWTMATSIESIGMSNFMAALRSMLDGRGAMQPDMLDIFDFPYTSEK